MKKIILIDGNSLLFRAYYATAASGNLMTNKNGIPTNGLYGFTNMIEKILNDEIEYILVAFDYGKKTFRNKLLESYKGTRKETPQELVSQFPLVREYLQAKGIVYKELEGYEADDIIGAVSKEAEDNDFEVTVISGDQDMLQLVSDKTSVHLSRRVAGKMILEVNTPKTLQEKYQLMPDQIRDLKGLMGDKSDNIPGIPGIGEKTALKLLHEYQTVEDIIENSAEIKGKLGEKIRDHKQLGLDSKEIATILREIPLEYNLESFKYENKLTDELISFYRKYDMNSLLARLDLSGMNKNKKLEINIVDHIGAVEGDFSLVASVYDKNYHKSIILGYAIYNDKVSAYISYENALKDEGFKALLKDSKIKKYGYDIKRQVNASRWNQIDIIGYDFDLQLASYILNPSLKDDIKIVSDYHEYYDILDYEENVLGKGAKHHIPDIKEQAEYYIACAKAVYDLREPVLGKLEKEEQLSLYEEIELPLTYILADMEYEGISIDLNVLKQQEKQLETRIAELEKEIWLLAGEEFNINSPKQLGEILFENLGLPLAKKTKSGYSTAVDVLEKLKTHHPIIERVLDYRTLAKLNSTYLVGLQEQTFLDGKIHTIYNQALTQTGRLSSTNPNLQNIPIRYEEGKQIRKAFIPNKDYILSFDYSQIELRVLASLANVDSLIEAFNQDLDIHTKTASDIFGVGIKEVDSDMRRQAKAVNFGIIYGMSDFGLSEQIGVPLYQAKEFIKRYFETYPGIKKYMDDVVTYAQKYEYVITMLNRKRYVPEINSKDFMKREYGKRLAMNSPIQGSAADLLKIAMIKVNQLMKKHEVKSKMLLQVHDELVFDVCTDEFELMKQLVQEAMESAYPMKVRLKADGNYGKSWYDLK